MSLLLYILAAVFMLGIILVIVHTLKADTIFDRILGINVIGTLVVLILVMLSIASGRMGFVDLAILYALLNFIGIIAVLKYLRYESIGYSKSEDHGHEFYDLSEKLKAFRESHDSSLEYTTQTTAPYAQRPSQNPSQRSDTDSDADDANSRGASNR